VSKLKLNLPANSLKPSEINKIERCFNDVYGQMVQLYLIDEVFWQVVEILSLKRELHYTKSGGLFANFIQAGYAERTCTFIRTLADDRNDVHSLVRLLILIRKDSKSFAPRIKQYAQNIETYSKKPPNKVLSIQIERLKKYADTVIKFTSSKIVHRTSNAIDPKTPKYEELRDVSSYFYLMFQFCYYLLTHGEITMPVIQLPWTITFREKWLLEDDKLPKFKSLNEILDKLKHDIQLYKSTVSQ